MESCATLLSRELKSNLFHLFATWGGPYAKPLGIVNHSSSGGSISGNGTVCAEEAKLQFGALTVCKNVIKYYLKKKIKLTLYLCVNLNSGNKKFFFFYLNFNFLFNIL